jgi:hypothetical protein
MTAGDGGPAPDTGSASGVAAGGAPLGFEESVSRGAGEGTAATPGKYLERVLRRETHSSRALPSTLAALLVCVLALYALLESMLRALDQPAWLADPLEVVAAAARWPAGTSPVLLAAAGFVILLIGLMFFLAAILPGRRAKHVLPHPRLAVVVADEVLAAALARAAKLAAGVAREQVMVVVTRHAVTVSIRPTSGIGVDTEAVRRAVDRELDRINPSPRPQAEIRVAPIGVVGV